ncbi:MAG: DEAD/DEAH box helicase [Synergistes sp.]|nr:DEAD/DEAH box helicase [Synergistes sp.]
MLILHTAFDGDSVCLWGERSFDAEDVRLWQAEDNGDKLPWGADCDALYAALKTLGIKYDKRSAKSQSEIFASVSLPSFDGVPVPSSAILGETVLTGAPEIVAFGVHAVILDFEQLAQLAHISRDAQDRLPAPGLLFADDVRFFCDALEYVSTLIVRGCYIPDMKEYKGNYLSQWRPIILAKDNDEFSAFVTAMPPVLCGFSADGSQKGVCGKYTSAMLMLECLTDMMLRYSQSQTSGSGKRIDSDNPHDIWLRSLLWQKAPLDKWRDEMSQLYPQIRSWADSLKSVTARPWRLFMRLEEPLEEDDKWTLSWHLQSTRDLSLVIPAERVWSPTDTDRMWFAHSQTNPRRYMLEILGRLASAVPCVASALNTSAPCDCRMTLDELFDFIHDHLTHIMDMGILVQFPKNWGTPSERPKLSVRANVHEGAAFSVGRQVSMDDLLDVDWSVALGDDVLTSDELAMLADLKTPIANIRGKWIVIYRDEVEKITSSLKKLPKEITRRDILLSSVSQECMDIPLSNVNGSQWLKNISAMLTGQTPLDEEAAPQGFVGTLRPYQAHGLCWLSRLAKLGMGACLADDMGLGKTVQTLALIKKLRGEGETRPVLLICPTSVMENWRRETEKFTPGANPIIHHGSKRASNKDKFTDESLRDSIVISSYSLLYRDNALLSKIAWAGIILDEAQNIKNPDTRQSKAARSIKADWHIALTGTPVENHVGDMWSIMEFLMPGLMPNRAKFSRQILRPVQAGNASAIEKVKRMTSPFILRRLKTDKAIISDLPEKIESREFCPLSREQATLYSTVTKSLEEEISAADGIKRKGIVLAAVTALKQICDHPLLYLKDNSEIENRSGKMARLAELAEEISEAGDRALIFTQYAEMGTLIKKFLQETFGREVLFLHGGVPREKRDEMVGRFQNDEDGPQFFILSLKAGGTGLNLTRASHVIMFDRWWNPAVEQQAVDRAYRIGQHTNVQVHYMCCRGTLEEKIEELIANKREIADLVVTSGEAKLSELSDSELHELFALDRKAVETL